MEADSQLSQGYTFFTKKRSMSNIKTPITAFLNVFYSAKDRAGNCEWAIRFTDVATGNVVEGVYSGGESNAYGVLFHWGVKNDWDRSVDFSCTEMPIRKWQRMTKGWAYLGCLPQDIAQAIKNKLASMKSS